jgi:hypothetical protein
MEIITRSQAKAADLPRYWTGKACAHGHVAERYTKNAMCIECTNSYNRGDANKAAHKRLAQTPEYRERSRLNSAAYHAANRDQVLERMAARNRAYYEKNKEQIKAQTSEYQRVNSAARNAYKSRWMTERAKVDPEFAMLLTMRKLVTRMMDRIRAKRVQSARTTEIVGFTPAEFVAHIEPMFKKGMTWANHGLWHVDHIRPLSTFDLTDPQQQKMANSLHNLQPMWAKPNMRKSDSWSGQASLI